MKRTPHSLFVSALAYLGAALFSHALHAQAPRTADTTFGIDGRARVIGISTATTLGTSTIDTFALQTDGKIVLVGRCADVPATFCVARLTPNGTLDPTFVGPSGNAAGLVSLPIGIGESRATSVTVQFDNRIVIAGLCGDSSVSVLLLGPCIARLNTDGSFDETFDGPMGNGNGRFSFSFNEQKHYPDVSLLQQPDGKIIYAMTCGFRPGAFCVVRFNADGSFDQSFGTGGKRVLSLAAWLGGEEFATFGRAVLQADGKIFLGGVCAPGGRLKTVFCVTRLNSNGSVDTTFNASAGPNAGVRLIEMDFVTQLAGNLSMQLAADGKLVFAHQCTVNIAPSVGYCFARIRGDGETDETFIGPAGTGRGSFYFAWSVPSSFYAENLGMRMQPDGKLLLVGKCYPTEANSRSCVAQLENDGSLNSITHNPSDGNTPDGLAIAFQPDGQILAIGCQPTDWCVFRFNGGPYEARRCSLDLDGDGRVLPAIDSLISARVALGFRGVNVINGLSFPSPAKRNTWSAIRDFLVAQCGLNIY